jgi:hypothetical protein
MSRAAIEPVSLIPFEQPCLAGVDARAGVKNDADLEPRHLGTVSQHAGSNHSCCVRHPHYYEHVLMLDKVDQYGLNKRALTMSTMKILRQTES